MVGELRGHGKDVEICRPDKQMVFIGSRLCTLFNTQIEKWHKIFSLEKSNLYYCINVNMMSAAFERKKKILLPRLKSKHLHTAHFLRNTQSLNLQQFP